MPITCPACGAINFPEDPSPSTFSSPIRTTLKCSQCSIDLPLQEENPYEASLEGERRFVVVMFTDIAGFTRLAEQLDPEESTNLVNRCLDELTRIAVQHGARLVRYLGDGMMAVFGAPIAHEDDLEQALSAAKMMQENISQFGLDEDTEKVSLHIGLACGQVVAAGVGGQGRKEYNVIGSAVNLAARLEEISSVGQILVSQELAQLTNHAFIYKPILIPMLHGWNDEVRAYGLIGKREQIITRQHLAPHHVPLIGRQIEISQLQQVARDLAKGKGSILSLVGEVGVGKSRLLSEFHTLVNTQEPGLAWIFTQALETNETQHYGCIRSMMRQIIFPHPGTDRNGDLLTKSTENNLLMRHLQDVLPEQADTIVLYMEHLLGLPIPSQKHNELAWMNDETLISQVTRAFQTWVIALAKRQHLIIAFEDVHWADTSSIAMIQSLFPLVNQHPLSIIVSMRPEPGRKAWDLRLKASKEFATCHIEIDLQPLPEEEVRILVSSILGDREAPRPVVTLVLQRAEGNPLFIEEMVRSLIDRGALVQNDRGEWGLGASWQETTIPNTIQGILQARIDRLSRDSKRLIQLASCTERPFPKQILLDLASGIGLADPKTGNKELMTLKQAGLLYAGDETDSFLSFKHVLIRETIYRSLLRSTRVQFHADIACWYEEHGADTETTSFSLLAYHYGRAENEAKLTEYLIKAGYQAMGSYANAEAREYFTQALKLTTEPALRFELLLQREHVCNLIGDRDIQRTDLEELLKAVNDGADDSQRAVVYTRLAIWHESWGEYLAARTAFEQALSAAQRLKNIESEAECLHHIASAAWRQGNYSEAIAYAQSALEVSRAAASPLREAVSLTTLGVVHRTLGNLDKAHNYYQMALDLRRRLGDRREIAISMSQFGNVHYDLGMYWVAHNYHNQALELFRSVGDRRGEAWSLAGVGSVYLSCGDTAEAYQYFSEALSIRRSIHDRRGEGVALGDLGNVLSQQGKLDEAIELLREAVCLLKELGARRDEVYALTYLGRALEIHGDLEGAQQANESALTKRRESGQQKSSLDNLAALVRIALAKGERDTAHALAKEITSDLRQHGIPTSESPFLIYLSAVQVLRACDETEQARTLASEAQSALYRRAEQITHIELRRKYLEQVPEHREILQIF